MPNTFYDEQFEVKDDSSTETNGTGDDQNIPFQTLKSSTFSKDKLASVPTSVFKQTKGEPPSRIEKYYHNINGGHGDCDNSHGECEGDDCDESSQNDNQDKLAPDLIQLFQCINEYKPKEIKIEIESKLKCFLPPYIPSVGEVDPFIKVPRPDKKQDGLGLVVIDEPSSKQSDAAVLELQLRAQMKKKMRNVGAGGSAAKIRCIENASKNPHDIDKWIRSVQDLRESKPVLAEVQYKDPSIMPSLHQMMHPFPSELQAEFDRMMEAFNSRGKGKQYNSYSLLDPEIDLSLGDYTKVICALLDVPVVDGHLIQSLHFIFNLCIEYQKDLHGDAVSVL